MSSAGAGRHVSLDLAAEEASHMLRRPSPLRLDDLNRYFFKIIQHNLDTHNTRTTHPYKPTLLENR